MAVMVACMTANGQLVAVGERLPRRTNGVRQPAPIAVIVNRSTAAGRAS